MDPNKITYFAETDSRNRRVPFGIKAKDRTKHVYVIGKTGMGKSSLLENMAIQDIQNGEGLAFIDPHGKTAELLLEYVPEHRIKDVLYFAPFDLENPIAFNVMEDVGADKRHLVANGLMSAFKKIWVDAWSARMEYILNNILLALLEYPGATIIGVNRMLADKDYRKKVVDNISDISVKEFWEKEFAKYGERYMQEAGAAIQNKIGQFISNPLIRNIVGQGKSSFDLRSIMDNRKIVIINLSKGRVGEANANLLGSMLITKIYLAAMSRADISERDLQHLPNFYLYVDEFQSFANESFADILSEARKYKLNLTMAHQYIEQMTDEVRAAVFGNVGTMIIFRVGAYDAEVLEKEFAPQFTAEDIVNLGMYQIYLKLMIDGVSSVPFSAVTLPPIKKLETTSVSSIIDASRKAFARPRMDVENEIRQSASTQSPATGNNKDAGSRPVTGQRETSINKEKRMEVPPLPKSDFREELKKIAETQKFDNQSNQKSAPTASSSSSQNLPRSAENQRPNFKDGQSHKAPVGNLHKGTLKDSKGPTQENVSELKKALSALVKDLPNQTQQTNSQSEKVNPEDKRRGEVSPKVQPTQNPQVLSKSENRADKQTTKEVPEEVLKRVLNVDK